MQKVIPSFLVVVSCAVMAMALGLEVTGVQAADKPPVIKESKPAEKTMSGTEQKGSNVGRNATTKPTAPQPPPKK